MDVLRFEVWRVGGPFLEDELRAQGPHPAITGPVEKLDAAMVITSILTLSRLAAGAARDIGCRRWTEGR